MNKRIKKKWLKRNMDSFYELFIYLKYKNISYWYGEAIQWMLSGDKLTAQCMLRVNIEKRLGMREPNDNCMYPSTKRPICF